MLFYNSKYVFISKMALANFSVSYWDPNAENIPCYVKEQFSNIHLWQCRLWSFKLEYIKIDRLLHKSELIQKIFCYISYNDLQLTKFGPFFTKFLMMKDISQLNVFESLILRIYLYTDCHSVCGEARTPGLCFDHFLTI